MKYFVSLSFLALLISCKKDTPSPRDISKAESDSTFTPKFEPVTTDIIGFITDENDQVINYSYMFNVNGKKFPIMSNGTVSTGPISTDKNTTKGIVEANLPDYLFTNKSFSVTACVKNYVRIKVLNHNVVGQLQNVTGGVYNLSNGIGLKFGPNSFYQLGSPGYFGPELITDIVCTYYDPASKEFARRLPAYLAGDSAKQRWFLKSFGAMNLRMIGSQYWREMGFYGGAKADVRFPIPSSMLAQAPDSLPTWKLSNGEWVKDGLAKKVNNFYETKIGEATAWNFAVPVKGIYLTVGVRTDSNSTFTNNTVRIKMNDRVIAESQTDADGNAVCFVPSNEQLTLEVLPDGSSKNIYSFPVAEIKKSSSITVKIPTNTDWLTTLSADVFNCGNERVKSGIAKISMNDGRDFFIPIMNGRFITSLWLSSPRLYGTTAMPRVLVTDNSTGTQSDATFAMLRTNSFHHINLYTCQNAPQLYCNYSVDGKSYELVDNANSASVFMTASKASSYDWPTIKTTKNNLGVNFRAWAVSTGIWSSAFSNIMVNGVTYQPDSSQYSEIAYSRFDNNTNGYLEGWFSFYYLDNGNVSHHVTGEFKVKRTF